MPTIDPIVYLPVESKHRELNARLLLACALIRSGHHVVIGVGHEIVENLGTLPPGVFLAKGLNKVQLNMIENVTRIGHVVVAIDEECLGISDPWYMMRDVAEGIAGHVHTVYCQGKVQRDALSRFRGFSPERLQLTGNPRVDLMRDPLSLLYAQETEEIRARRGQFILINTNSGSINNLWGDLDVYRRILTEIGWADASDPEDRLLVEDHIEHDRNNVSAIKEFVANVAKLDSGIRMVLRPHPSEKPDNWVEFAASFDSLDVLEESEPTPWLLAADLVVTTGCTTATEAIVMGKDAISLVAQPKSVRHPSFFLANQVALRESNARQAAEDSVLAIRGDRRAFRIDEDSRARILDEHIHGNTNTPAFESIAEHISTLIRENGSHNGTSSRFGELSFFDHLDVKKVAWEKAYSPPQELSARLSQILKIMRWELNGNLRAVGHGTYLLSPAG